MNTETRERAILPILIPLLAIIVTEVVVFSMSRVLLATGKNTAAVIGLAAALGILVGAAFIAARPRIRTATIFGFLGLLAIGTIGVGAFASMQKPFYEREAEADRPRVEMSADNLEFSSDELELATGGTLIAFANNDTQPHNIAVYLGEDATASALFKGEIIDGGQSINYEAPRAEAGEYYFQCDVHPNMNGTAVVAEAAEGSAEHA